ncbi:MAG: hypothetical protein ACKOXV_05180 [Bacteroidota bacterium]
MPIKSRVLFFIVIVCLSSFIACTKWTVTQSPSDPRLTQKYCNDPFAVNYNWGFPGLPDNSTCVYPADLYLGTYLFHDSIYSIANVLIDTNQVLLHIYKQKMDRVVILGFTTAVDSLFVSVLKNGNGSLDSLQNIPGQLLSNVLDTVNGTCFKYLSDTLRLKINWKLKTATGIYFHKGSAIKQ